MSHRLALLAALAATVAAGACAVATASANNVAWSLSIGVPGLAVSAGAPAYGVAAPVYGPGYRPAYGYAPYRPWHRPYAPAPIVYGAPVVAAYPYAAYPYAAALAYSAPVVVAPRFRAPHRVVVAPYLPPRPLPYGWN